MEEVLSVGRTYKAILRGDRIEWIDPPPERKEPTPVSITLQEDAIRAEGGGAMAEALRAIAQGGGLSSILDPRAWQREVREDRPMPERDP